MDDNNTVQTDADIIAEFEDLFGGSQSQEDNEPDDTDTQTEENPDEEADESEEYEEDSEEDESGEDDEDSSQEQKTPVKDNGKKQKEAFYKMRTTLKAYENLFGRLSTLFDLSETGDPQEVVAKIEEAITQREAEQSKIPVEFLQRMQEMEKKLAQTESIERETRVTDELANLGEKYDLSEEAMEEFLFDLSEDGKNPLENDVDLEAEFLKRHINEILETARNEGTQQENERKDKIKKKAPGSLPDKKDSSGGKDKIETISDLNSFLDTL